MNLSAQALNGADLLAIHDRAVAVDTAANALERVLNSGVRRRLVTRQEQRRRERELLEAVLGELDLKPDSLADGLDPPDFIMEFEGQTLAIEVTEYHSSERRRQVEETWNDLRSVAAKRREGHPQLDNLSVSLELQRVDLPARGKHRQFVDEVISFCEARVKTLGDGFSHHDPRGSGLAMMETYVKDIQLRNVGCYMEWDCSTLNSGAVGLTQPELFRALAKKVTKPLPHCGQDANWLFAIDGVRLSQILGLMFADTLNSYGRVNKVLRSSPYQRVYLCGYQIARWTHTDGWVIVKDR